MSLGDIIHHEFHGEVRLRCCHHVSCCWYNDQGEQVVVPIVATNKFSARIIFVVVGVDFPGLNVKLLPIFEVNTFGPFHGLTNSVFHIKLTNIDQYLETLRE